MTADIRLRSGRLPPSSRYHADLVANASGGANGPRLTECRPDAMRSFPAEYVRMPLLREGP